jgi:RNA polymerase sigma-70 factor, ECF subfamily
VNSPRGLTGTLGSSAGDASTSDGLAALFRAGARSQTPRLARIRCGMPSDATDEELLAAGGIAGFEALYERRYPLVRGYLRRRLGPRPDLVLDLVAETFARALERRQQFDPQRGPVVAWLLSIAHNLLVDAARAGRVADASRRRLGMERISLEDDELEAIERNSVSDLERALQELPDEQRQAIERRVLDEEPYAEIAAQIGCSEQVVRKRVSRGLATLRRTAQERT